MAKQPSGWVTRLMRRAGYVPIARARELSDKFTRVEQRNMELAKALDEAREAAQTLKDKLRDRSERADRVQQDHSEVEKKYQERMEKLDQKTEREIARLREHDTARSARVDDLRERMAWAEKSTQLGREHLMAIEVKLDIVEGAIKVLDQRTRAALAAARDARDPVRESARLS
jgi:predicted nuclease with TOPRIM domain